MKPFVAIGFAALTLLGLIVTAGAATDRMWPYAAITIVFTIALTWLVSTEKGT